MPFRSLRLARLARLANCEAWDRSRTPFMACVHGTARKHCPKGEKFATKLARIFPSLSHRPLHPFPSSVVSTDRDKVAR